MGSAIFSRRLTLGLDAPITGVGPVLNSLTVTVPSGTVSETLTGFLLSVSTTLNPALVVSQVFYFNDTDSNSLPFHLVSYDDWSGQVDLVAKTTLRSDVDNVFHILYG